MERELGKTKLEPEDDLEMRVDKLESFGKPNIEKRLIKTEEAIDCGENRVVTGLEKKISELEKCVLEKDRALEAYRDRMKGLGKEIEESKRKMKSKHLDLALSLELVRQKNVEANQMVVELTRKLLACEEEKKMADCIQEDMKRRESENARCVEDLRRQNLEASRSLEELRHRLSVCEEETKMANRVQEEMKHREIENIRCVEDLRQRNFEASRSVEELRHRISVFEEEKQCRESENVRIVEELRRQNLEAAQEVEELRRRVAVCEEEKKMGDRVQEEMKCRESENIRCVEELRDRILACEEEKRIADRVREEMKARELDLRRELSRAEQSVKEMERGLEACKVAEVNVKKLGNVVPIVENLCQLLRTNMDDLVSVKDKFVSADFGDGANTAHGGEGGSYASKALESTISEQSTKSPETRTMPSSAAELNSIINCDDNQTMPSSAAEFNGILDCNENRTKKRKEITTDCCHVHRRLLLQRK